MGLAGGEGRVSHPFRNMKFCLNYSLSFKILSPFSWLPTLVGYQATGTIPPTLDSCEDPGKVSTLTGVPARQSPRDPRGPAWPLAGGVLLSRLFSLLGRSLPIWKMKRLGRTISEVVPTNTDSLLGTVQKSLQWPEELFILPTL